MTKKERIEKVATQIVSAMIATPKALAKHKVYAVKYAVDIAEQLIEEIDKRH